MAVERHTDPRHQLRRREGLDDVVGRARFQRPCDGLAPPGGGDEDDRHIGERGQGAHQLDAVGAGQHEVEHRERGMAGLDQAGHLARRGGRFLRSRQGEGHAGAPALRVLNEGNCEGDTLDRMGSFAGQIGNKRITYRKLTAPNGLSSEVQGVRDLMG